MDMHAGVLAVSVGIIVFGMGMLLWWLLDRRYISEEERELREQWEADMATYVLPEYDGATWDWPAGGLAAYFFGEADAAEAPTAAHATADWFDAYDFEAETEHFITSMRARTDHYITQLSQPLPALAR